jgi:DNA repair exonuclease SbcCD ATPase subunit
MFIPVSIHIQNITTHKDTLFEFKQGQTVLVNGENKDDRGQGGNGAGKSGLNESISLAITGKSIRDVPPRELISDFEKSANIKFCLYNTNSKKTLWIDRTFFANSNPQICKVWYEGEDTIVKSNVLHYSQWILNEIGISEEYFFAFYLITKERYTPFFSTTDLSKKTVVNQFSGANEVDKVEPKIKSDIQFVEIKNKKINEDILQKLSKREVYQNILDKLVPNKEEVENQRTILEEKYLQYGDEWNQLEYKVYELNDDANYYQVIVDEFINPFDAQIFEKRSEINSIDLNINNIREELNQVEIKYQNEIKVLNTDIKTGEEELKAFQSEIQRADREKIIENKKLIDSIECPECKHVFNLKDKSFDLDKCVKKIQAYEEEEKLFEAEALRTGELILKHQKNLSQVQQKIIDECSVLNEQKSELQKKFGLFKSELEVLEKSSKEKQQEKVENEKKAKQLSKEADEYQDRAKKVKKDLDTLRLEIDSLGNIDKKKEAELNSTLSVIDSELSLLRDSLQIEVDELHRLNTWLLNFKKFKSYLANRSLSNISDYTNLFLDKIGSDLSITLDGYRLLSDGKLKEELSTIINRRGLPIGNYGRFSAGERGRIDFANIVGMQEMSNLNSTNGLDLLIIDEILDSCDSLGINLILEGSRDLGKTIMIISQNQVNYENKIKIIKQNGISTIE